jgi:hypothetical protein
MKKKLASTLPAPSKALSKKTEPPCGLKELPIVVRHADEIPKVRAMTTTKASLNAAIVVDAFQSNIMGKDLSLSALMDSMSENFAQVSNGDLTAIEAMLVGQATALQTMFTHLAKRAASQEYLSHYQTYLTLAMKAQAQSRATISALIELKYPRQGATFVKQANISSGHQQINNLAKPSQYAHAHAGNSQTAPNKLLEDDHGQRLDFGAQTEAISNHQRLETVGAIHRGNDTRG